MTRKQVAQRLGKSIATVRRLEGVLLHPMLDARGKARFDDAEVEQLVGAMERGEVTLWQHMRGKSEPLEGIAEDDADQAPECVGCVERDQQLAHLKRELGERERTHRSEVETLRAERAQYLVEQRELENELGEFLALLETD